MQKKNYSINIKVLTGMHIGVGNDKPEIGGIDNAFVKDPISKLPYIPGSSLKGKLRFLLETESNNFNKDVIDRCFGDDSESPTRFIFRDISLSETDAGKFANGSIQTEVKTEIKIDRNKGTATPGALRTTERVPPQTLFSGEVIIRSLDDDDAKINKAVLEEAVKMLNNDYLGGSGSRERKNDKVEF
jgi:CRISPR-associated protein Csm3